MDFKHATLAAFGATRLPGRDVEDDAALAALLEAETPIVTLVGKSWTLHVDEALRTTSAENLAMVADSVAYMAAAGRRVVFDAEHFFDGYLADRGYALEVLAAAADAGADTLALCDTNGGTLPDDVAASWPRSRTGRGRPSACTSTTTPRARSPTRSWRWRPAACTCRARPTATASAAATPTCSR